MKKNISGLEERKQEDRVHALLGLAADQPAEASECPDAESLAALIDGTADPVQREELLSHLASCPDCYETWMSIALPDQEERKTGRIIKGPWYTRIGQSMFENKAAAAALAAAACLVLVVTTRLVVPPPSPVVDEQTRTSSAPPIFFQQSDIARLNSFVKGYRQVAVTERQKRVVKTRGAAPPEPVLESTAPVSDESDFSVETAVRTKGGQVQPNKGAASRKTTVKSIDPDESFGLWLGKLTRECRQGRDKVVVTDRTQLELVKFKKELVQQNSAWEQSAGNFLLRLEPLLTEPDATVQCARLLPLINVFVQNCTKRSTPKSGTP